MNNKVIPMAHGQIMHDLSYVIVTYTPLTLNIVFFFSFLNNVFVLLLFAYCFLLYSHFHDQSITNHTDVGRERDNIQKPKARSSATTLKVSSRHYFLIFQFQSPSFLFFFFCSILTCI